MLEEELVRLGGHKIIDIGLGDDKDEDKYLTRWEEWTPEAFQQAELPLPPDELMPPLYKLVGTNVSKPKGLPYMTSGSKALPLLENSLLTPEDYERDVRHYVFDMSDSKMSYSVGDALGVFPYNDPQEISKWMEKVKLADDTLDFRRADGGINPYGDCISAHQLFTEVLDTFGKPTRRF